MSFMKWSIRELRINMTIASLLPAMCMTVSVAWGSLRCARGQTVSIHLHQASDGCQFAPHAPCISLTVNRQAPLSWQDEGKIRPLKCFLNRPFIKPGRDSIVVAVFGWNPWCVDVFGSGDKAWPPWEYHTPHRHRWRWAVKVFAQWQSSYEYIMICVRQGSSLRWMGNAAPDIQYRQQYTYSLKGASPASDLWSLIRK